MRVAMWSSYLIELTPEEMVNTFVQHGWDCTELSDEHALTILERGDPEKEGEKFRAFAEDQGFDFPQGHLWLGVDIAEPDDAEQAGTLDRLKLWCDLFAAVGVSAAVLHPGGGKAMAAGWEAARIAERRTAALQLFADHVTGGPLTICLENMPPSQLQAITAQDMLDLVSAVGSDTMALCLDTGHLNWAGGHCGDFARRAGGKLKALHVTDSIGEHDDHLLPHGAGNIDWVDFAAALKETGYDGLFNYEVPRENRCPMDIRLAKLDYALHLAKIMVGDDR